MRRVWAAAAAQAGGTVRPVIHVGGTLAGPGAHRAAAQRAREERRDWIRWHDREGAPRAAPVSAAAVRDAMLAVGPSGRAAIYGASGTAWTWGWERLNAFRLELLAREAQEGDTDAADG